MKPAAARCTLPPCVASGWDTNSKAAKSARGCLCLLMDRVLMTAVVMVSMISHQTHDGIGDMDC